MNMYPIGSDSANFELLLRRLGPIVLSFRKNSADLDNIGKIRLLSSQTKFFTGLIYIGRQEQFLSLENIRVYSGAIIIACEAKTPLITDRPEFANVTVLEASCSVAAMFNNLSRILINSNFAVPEDTRMGLNQVWDNIMSSKLLSKQDIEEALTNVKVNIKKFFRVLVVQFADKNVENTAYIALRDRLDEVFTDGEVLKYNNCLVVLMFHPERELEPSMPDGLEEVLAEAGAYMMIGHALRDYSMMRTQFLMSYRTLYLAIRLAKEPNKRVFHIGDYGIYYAVDMCAQRAAQVFGHMDVILLVHPAVVAVKRFDLAHKSDLLETLVCYLKNSGSLQKTSDEMFMHRNTVNNKVNKLKALIPLDLDDGQVRQQLLFACQTLEYYEKILEFRIPED